MAYGPVYYEANKERIKARQAAYRQANPERTRQVQRKQDLRRRFGLTPEVYDRMLEAQGGKCKICGGTNTNGRALAVDHDHSCPHCAGHGRCGQCVRGLVCEPCNLAVGMMKDSPERLRKAAEYLEKWTQQRV